MFNKSNFCHIASNNRNEQKGSVFIYKTTDTLAQVTQSGYFNEKLIDINVHDLIIHVQYDPVARTLKKSVLIVTERTLDNVETAPILDQTIGDDIDQLGDQVAGIEEKIPSDASSTNQLATQNDITNKITNCITEIPQDIKLELNNGTLTLKAGSKLHRAAGNLNDTITIASDIRATIGDNGQWMIILTATTNLYSAKVEASTSGKIANRPSSTTEARALYFATDENEMYLTGDSGTTWYTGADYSLPICIVTTSNGAISSIDQVFNGFGYIGSTVFALPGVKGLIPNGRNADGSLKNIEFTTQSVLTVSSNLTKKGKLFCKHDGLLFAISPSYDEYKNYNDNYGRSLYCDCGNLEYVSGSVNSLTLKTTFHAVDYSDTEFIGHQAMPSDRYIDLNLGASGTSYTAPDDGWFVVAKSSAGTNEYINMVDKKTNLSTATNPSSSGVNCRVFLPTSKNNVVTISYNLTGTTNTFRFIYANGAK